MGVVIKKTGSLNNIETLSAHMKYIGFRSIEMSEKNNYFDKHEDKVDYKKFIKRIKGEKALRHPKSVKGHKIIFSLKEQDYKNYQLSGKSYKDLIRRTLNEYENKRGIKLDWIAHEHLKDGHGNSNHPHVHVVVKGVSEKDSEGHAKRVYFNKEDFKELKLIFDKEFEKECEYTRGIEREYENGINRRDMKDLIKGIDNFSKGLAYELEKEEMQNQIKKNKQIRKRAREKDREMER